MRRGGCEMRRDKMGWDGGPGPAGVCLYWSKGMGICLYIHYKPSGLDQTPEAVLAMLLLPQYLSHRRGLCCSLKGAHLSCDRIEYSRNLRAS